MYAYGFTPHRHQKAQGLVRAALVAPQSVDSLNNCTTVMAADDSKAKPAKPKNFQAALLNTT